MNLEGMRAVVIDDVYDEVKDLLQALNRKGISYNYYSNFKDLPLFPQEGIRLVFLDFNLNASGDVDSKTKESVVESFLSKIISQDNGPYILIVWATSIENDEVLKLLKERLPQSQKSLPLLIIEDFQKDELKDNAEKIINKIEEKIKLDKIVNILFQWERFGHEALNETLKNFIGENEDESNLDDFLEKVDKKIKNDFKKYTELELGTNAVEDKSLLCIPQMLLNDFFKEKSDLLIMNQNYNDNLISEIKEVEINNYGPSEKAQINSLFNLNFNESFKGIKPGKVYDVDEDFLDKFDFQFSFNKEELRKEISKTYFKEDIQSDEINTLKIIAMEITPECDFSQDNWKTHKMIFGILIPEDFPKNVKKLPNSITKPLLIREQNESKNYFISFNCLFFKTIKKESISDVKSIFSLRKSFFSEVQHLFANHTSRPGKIEFN